MATVATIELAVKTRITQFQKGLAKARKSLAKFAKAIPLANRSAAGLGVALAVGVAAGLVSVINKTRLSIDELGKFSDEMNVSTQALQEFQLATALTGTKQETLKRGMQRLIARIGEAAVGVGEGVKGFKMLGLEASKLQKLPLDQQMIKISEATRRMSSRTEQAAALYAIFGRQGVELINFMLLGADGFKKVSDQAGKLGFTLDRVTVKAVENANDSIELSQVLLKGYANQITAQVTPSILELSKAFIKLGESAPGATSGVEKNLQKLVSTVGLLARGFDFALVGWNLLQANLGTGFLAIMAPLRAVTASLKIMVKLLSLGQADLTFFDEFDEFFNQTGKGVLQDLVQAKDAFKRGITGSSQEKIESGFANSKTRSRQEAVAALGGQAAVDKLEANEKKRIALLEEMAKEARETNKKLEESNKLKRESITNKPAKLPGIKPRLIY